MKKIVINSTVALAFVTFMSGCATMFSGSTQSVTVNSVPKGATVKINSVEKCVTPCTVELDKDNETKLSVSKDGYKEVSEVMNTDTDPWLLANIIFGGLIGTTVDFSTGAVYEYKPDSYHIELKQE